MKIDRRQLRRLIESVINEETKEKVTPKSVRATVNGAGYDGITYPALNKDGDSGVAIVLGYGVNSDPDQADVNLVVKRLKKVYGDNLVSTGDVEKIAGGSAKVKRIKTGAVGFEFTKFHKSQPTNTEMDAQRDRVRNSYGPVSQKDLDFLTRDNPDQVIFVKMD